MPSSESFGAPFAEQQENGFPALRTRMQEYLQALSALAADGDSKGEWESGNEAKQTDTAK